jgi:hypothetical protein
MFVFYAWEKCSNICALEWFNAECMMWNIRTAELFNGQAGIFSWIWIESKSDWPLFPIYLIQRLSFLGFAMHKCPQNDINKWNF